jgi:hypothetical protein
MGSIVAVMGILQPEEWHVSVPGAMLAPVRSKVCQPKDKRWELVVESGKANKLILGITVATKHDCDGLASLSHLLLGSWSCIVQVKFTVE